MEPPVSLLQNFWDLILWFLWIFVFVAYLMALFSIIADLFRDRNLNGWWKAVWLLFLFVVPFLTALVYLIARGRGMAERQYEQVAQAQSATDNYIRTVASASPADEIATAKSLLDSGAINQAEFDQIKARALSHSSK